MSKLRVGVLMGGKSLEREVSFNSGRTICDHLDTSRYEIIPIFQTHTNKLFILPWHFLHRGAISDFFHRLEAQAEQILWDDLKSRIDFVYIAMHGRYAEDGTLQGFLELLGIPYLGSKILASALGMDKIMQKKFLKAAGISVPRAVIVTPEQLASVSNDCNILIEQLAQQTLSFPLIVKPYKEGSSFGVSMVHSVDQLYQAVHKAAYINSLPQSVLIEEKIVGMEFACITMIDTITGQPFALPPTEVVTGVEQIFDYEQKYMPGKSQEYTPARVNASLLERIQETCITVMKTLHMSTIARIDGFVTASQEIVIIDPNTLSGMAPASFLFREAAHIQMSHTQVINHLIETELQAAALISSTKDMGISMQQPSIRVGVLLGGSSNEREISLESGRNVLYKLSPHTYQGTALFVTQENELYAIDHKTLVLNSTTQIAQTLTAEQKISWSSLPDLFDFVFIALHGGPGENGAIQGTLELLGIPYNGSSVLASALCIDKFRTNNFLRAQGFEVPLNRLINKDDWNSNRKTVLSDIQNTISFPCIVKPHNDGCSVLVHKAHSAQELSAALDTIFSSDKEYALLEEYIIGMELTVGVLGNENPRALLPSQAISAGGILSIEEKFLPGAGENQTPAPLAPSTLAFVQNTIKDVFCAVGARGYARIDCFYQTAEQSPTGKDRVIILEINTLPGLTPATCIFHQAAELGIKPMDFIDKIITLGFQAHPKNPLALSDATARASSEISVQ